MKNCFGVRNRKLSSTGVDLNTKLLFNNITVPKMVYDIFEEQEKPSVKPIGDSKPSANPTRDSSPSSVHQGSENYDFIEDGISLMSIPNEDSSSSARLPINIPVSPVARGSKPRHQTKKKSKLRRSKNSNQRRNKAKTIMARIREPLKVYFDQLRNEGWLNEANMKDEMPTAPSFSMMHSLEEGFQIVMWSCTHNHKLGTDFKVHRNSKIRFIMPKNMGIMWHEALFHGGSKSRSYPDGTTMEYMRLFTYLWQLLETSDKRNSSVDLNDGVSRECGRDLHRDNFDMYMCKYATLFGNGSCKKCNQGETVISLTHILLNSYSRPGEIIIGDLKLHGWTIFRGVDIDDATQAEINVIANKGIWKGIESRGKGHKMKYDWNSKLPTMG